VAPGGDVESDVALHLHRADDECAGRDKDGAAMVFRARVDGRLQSRGVESGTIAFRAEVADVVGAGAESAVGGLRLGGGGGCAGERQR